MKLFSYKILVISVQSKIYSFIFMCGTVMFLRCLRRVTLHTFLLYMIFNHLNLQRKRKENQLFFLPKLDKRVIINSSTLMGQLSKAPVTVKPLSPKSDQHQLSRCNITAL